ncbi:MAG: methylamine utilization protein MauJ [Pyrinomonadaceae bacterium]
MHADLSVGESHLKFQTTSELSVILENSKDGSIETIDVHLLLNENKVLGKILCPRVSGANFDDAVTRAFRAVAMLLSQYSLYLDVPLFVDQVDSTEISTQISRVSLLMPFMELQINGDLTTGTGSSELSNYASYYREGLNSNSVAYKFLCYFKIIEGIHEMRNRINAERRQAGLEPWRPAIAEQIPTSRNDQEKFITLLFPYKPPWANSRLALDIVFIDDTVGKRISSLYSGKLSEIRVQIAHGLTKAGEPTISLDELLNQNEIIKWLPITRLIARLMIRNQFEDFIRS